EVLPSPDHSGHAGPSACDAQGRWWTAHEGFLGYWDGQRWTRAVNVGPGVNAVGCAAARGGGMWTFVGETVRRFEDGVETRRIQVPGMPAVVWSMDEDRL